MKTLACALAFLALGVGTAYAADDPAPRPTYAVGYLWPLADATYELTRIAGGEYVFVAPAGEIRLSNTLGLAGVRRGAEFLELTTAPELKWPLKPGDWGSALAEWRASRATETIFARNRMRPAPERIVWHAEGYEDVALPGRTVLALKILYQMLGSAFSARDVLEWEIAMWYAPSAGVFVKAVDRTFGVVNFELAPSANLAVLRARAGLPDPPPPAASLDSRRRHREAVETCGGRKCAAPSRPQTD